MGWVGRTKVVIWPRLQVSDVYRKASVSRRPASTGGYRAPAIWAKRPRITDLRFRDSVASPTQNSLRPKSS
jgi:hypothetical protein